MTASSCAALVGGTGVVPDGLSCRPSMRPPG